MSDDIKDEKPNPEPKEVTSQETPLSQSTYAELRKLDEYTLNGVTVTRRNPAEIGPITFTKLPQFTEEQERRLETQHRIERVLEYISKDKVKENVLTPEENEEAFQVYMHRRMMQARGGKTVVPPVPTTEEKVAEEPEYLKELRKQALKD